MKPTLTHIALHVRDVQASVDFYSEFCGMIVAHDRTHDGVRVAWMAEEGKDQEFVIVLVGGGSGPGQDKTDMGHLGFIVDSREAVDEIARRGAAHLVWEPQAHPPPVGYFCGLKDPDGNNVEFSCEQPLGPGNKPHVSKGFENA